MSVRGRRSTFFLLLALAAAGKAAEPGAALENEPRLQASVDVSAFEEPLGELVTRLGKAAGIPLRANGAAADEWVTLFARRRPLREVLSVLAEHFDFVWTRQTKDSATTYVLTQTVAARRREEALRAADLDRELAALRRQLDEPLRLAASPEGRAAAELPREERERRIKGLLERLYPEDGKRQPPGPEEARSLEQSIKLLRAVTPPRNEGPDGDSAFRVYAAVPAEVREALWQGQPIRFAFPREPGRTPVERETAVDLTAGTLGNLVSEGDGEDEHGAHLPFREIERLRSELALETSDGRPRLRFRMVFVGSCGRDGGETRRAECELTNEVGADEEYPDPKEWTARYLDAGAASLTDRVALAVRPEKIRNGNQETALADWLRTLSEQVPYCILSDAYFTVLHGNPKFAEKPLPEHLARLCSYYGASCRFRKPYLLFRNRNWARMRSSRAPARAVRRWEGSFTRLGGFPLEDLEQMASTLSWDGGERLLAWWDLRDRVPPGPRGMLAADLETSHHALRLLAFLPPAQRRALEAGRSLRLGELAPAAREEARRVFDIQETNGGGHGHFHYEDEDDGYVLGQAFNDEDRLENEWPNLRLSLRREPASWVFSEDEHNPFEMLDAALARERRKNPDIQPESLHPVHGEKLLLRFEVPGSEPLEHFFFLPRIR